MSHSVLVVSPHADDEVLGCGGVIAKHVAAGDEVRVHVVTKAIPEIFSEEYMVNVRAEALEAHRRLGVTETVFTDFPAPVLDQTPGYQIANSIAATSADWNVDTVYVPWRGDIHSDHRAVFDAAMVAFRPVSRAAPSKILAYETLSETEWALPFGDTYFKPTCYIGIEGHLDAKIDAMRAFESQLREFPSSRSIDAIEALARLRGATVGVRAAEAFVVMRETQL